MRRRGPQTPAQQQTIRADMKAKPNRYANMPRDARKSVRSDQEKLGKLQEGKADTSKPASAGQAEVRRLTARIVAAINNRQEERLVCTQEARTGATTSPASAARPPRSAHAKQPTKNCPRRRQHGSSAPTPPAASEAIAAGAGPRLAGRPTLDCALPGLPRRPTGRT